MNKNYENMTDEEKIVYNKELIQKYPFLLPRNRWTGKVPEDYDYSYTELDDMDTGWRIAFGEQLCKEIAEELKKYDYLDKYRIVQLKEKFGGMRLYDNGAPGNVEDIIDEYATLSEHTCVGYGAPATKISRGWICPWCDDCAAKREQVQFWSIEEYYGDFAEELEKSN